MYHSVFATLLGVSVALLAFFCSGTFSRSCDVGVWTPVSCSSCCCRYTYNQTTLIGACYTEQVCHKLNGTCHSASPCYRGSSSELSCDDDTSCCVFNSGLSATCTSPTLCGILGGHGGHGGPPN
mmetsp:Transcript_17788/g.45285  ORF Transcript_17788/g.45285 Transcript_17788/m.45285 type:complete len:124 (+) Transcript_17788:1902-2273(+)